MSLEVKSDDFLTLQQEWGEVKELCGRIRRSKEVVDKAHEVTFQAFQDANRLDQAARRANVSFDELNRLLERARFLQIRAKRQFEYARIEVLDESLVKRIDDIHDKAVSILMESVPSQEEQEENAFLSQMIGNVLDEPIQPVLFLDEKDAANWSETQAILDGTASLLQKGQSIHVNVNDIEAGLVAITEIVTAICLRALAQARIDNPESLEFVNPGEVLARQFEQHLPY